MSVAVDANLLLYASDRSSGRHTRAIEVLADLAAGPDLLYMFWPVAMAFLRISTHPSIFDRPLTPDVARRNLDDLITRPHVRTPGEGSTFWDIYQQTSMTDTIRGNLVPDAHIASLMRQHGVGTILTSDRDFRRFDGITARNPFDAPDGS